MPYTLVIPGGSGPNPPTPTAWPTLADLWETLADQVGLYCPTTVSSTTPTGEPGRWVIAEEFGDDEDPRDAFFGSWLYVKSGAQAGTQRRVRNEGYEGPYNAVALSKVLTVNGVPTNLAPDVFVALTSPLPVRRDGPNKGLVECIREATDRVWTEARIPLVGNGTRLYDLSGYPFITSQEWTNGVYDWCGQSAVTVPSERSPYAPTVKVNGQTITLITGRIYGVGVPFELAVFVRASGLLFDGTSWSYSTAGLVNDTDQVAVPINWITPIAMVKAIQYLRRIVVKDRNLSWPEKQSKIAEIELTLHAKVWAQAAAELIEQTFPRPHVATPPALVGTARVEDGLWVNETSDLPVSVLP